MGMQCHFNIKDLPNFSKVICYDYDTESYSYMIDSMWTVDCTISGDAWFDCGQCSVSALSHIEYLIKNRICFSCS